MTDFLAIETSSEACSVALHSSGETKQFFELAPMRHAELLLPAVQSLLDAAGLPLASLDAIAFGRGPGSFTSLRIGIGVVQGLAWGVDLPVVPISSLAAVAQQVSSAVTADSTSICVAMDARMQEVYTANFELGEDGLVKPSSAERVCSPGLVIPAGGPFIAAGNGFDRFEELQAMAVNAVACHGDIWPRAEIICQMAIQWLKSNKPLPAGLAQPVYVRNQVASKPAPDKL
jgi:tRNA threonylcarbamoyladenosine biosynthesis protein TsaB